MLLKKTRAMNLRKVRMSLVRMIVQNEITLKIIRCDWKKNKLRHESKTTKRSNNQPASMLPKTVRFALTQHYIFEDNWNEAKKQRVSLAESTY